MPAPVDSALAVRREEYVSDVATYRHEFRAWLREIDWADEWRNAAFDNVEDELAFHATMLARLHEAGWNHDGWPEDAGGFGGTEIQRGIIADHLLGLSKEKL